ncbi:MAG: phosphotransferase [Thermodesulfobacteriota bacterium]
MTDPAQIRAAASNFTPQPVTEIIPLAGGIINRTWRLCLKNGEELILQRLNCQVFKWPEQSCRNMALVGKLAKKLHKLSDRRWEIPSLRLTPAGEPWWFAPDGGLWRAMDFITGTINIQQVDSPAMAADIGRGLALFHQLVADISPHQLPATIDHFHDTPHYIEELERGVASRKELSPQQSRLVDFSRERSRRGAELASALKQGLLTTAIIHGDPKVENFLFDAASKRVCSLIDLDTVGPGLRLHDLGDCVRSCAARPAGPGALDFDLEICKEIVAGYQGQGPELLTGNDKKFLPRAIWLLPFELGVRFLSDQLSGAGYFRESFPGQNLQQAEEQFSLARAVEAKGGELASLAN